MKTMFCLSALALALCACGPDNQAYCEDAEADVIAAYEECGEDTSEVDFGCELYAETSSDCAEHFGNISDTVMCENGVVTFDFGSPCR